MNAPTPPEAAKEIEEVRLANRTSLLSIFGLLSFLVAAMAMPLTFQNYESVSARAIASTPLPVGVGLMVGARAARLQLRAIRRQEDAAETSDSRALGTPLSDASGTVAAADPREGKPPSA
jgi:hypothetical protein